MSEMASSSWKSGLVRAKGQSNLLDQRTRRAIFCRRIPTSLRPSNNLLFGRTVLTVAAGTKVQNNPLTINNKVTTASYPILPSLSQILHTG